MEPALLYVPFPSFQEARRVSRQLLEEKCVACVNIIPQVSSLYWWDGEITESQEVVGLFKTLTSHLTHVMNRLRELHPSQCPVILPLRLDETLPSVLTWLSESLEVTP